MNYSETIEYLYAAAPLFQQVGGAAYKEGLQTTLLLDEHFHHPHRNFRTIHVAGTNGKGSCAHTLAATLQHKGLKTGLYTSPHLVDFRERIRVNGQMIPEDYVVKFVEQERCFFEPLHPSFFELTTALAFKYFADAEVDVAVIEVGLGGRLDCTNIIKPVLSLITNISLDHTQFLGHSLSEIAIEKAGIIKAGIPTVIGESLPETLPVFKQKAKEVGTELHLAEQNPEISQATTTKSGLHHYETLHWGSFDAELVGEWQIRNANTILCAANLLAPIFNLETEDVQFAFRHVCEMTGLAGRWQTIGHSPLIVCDAGHNIGGWLYLSQKLEKAINEHPTVHVVFGMAADKDIDNVLSLLPQKARYYWTQASVGRALNAQQLQLQAEKHGLAGNFFETVPVAYEAALRNARPDDFIYVGGSCFVLADLLAYLKENQ